MVYTSLQVQPNENTTMTTLFALIAIYQYRENYGAHSWDGKGECPQYWKSKGEHEEVIKEGMTANEVLALTRDDVMKLINESNLGCRTRDDYVEYYLIDHMFVEFSPSIIEQVKSIQEQMCSPADAYEAALITGLSEYQCKWAMKQLVQ